MVATRILSAALLMAVAALGSGLGASERPLAVEEVTEGKLLEMLKPPAQTKTRSMRNLKPAPREANLTIPFALNSAKISPEGETALEALARAMKSAELSQSFFDLEGHTDRSGPLKFNLVLSEQRAASVRRFLEERGVSSDRLASSGYGWERLLPDFEPNAPEHRRVTIRAYER